MAKLPEWEQACPAVNEVLGRFAFANNATVATEYWTRDRNYQPNRLILWKRKGNEYSLTLTIEDRTNILDENDCPPFVRLQSTASRDYPENIRRMLPPQTKDLAIPVDKSTLQTAIDELLKGVKSRVSIFNLPNKGSNRFVATFPI